MRFWMQVIENLRASYHSIQKKKKKKSFMPSTKDTLDVGMVIYVENRNQYYQTTFTIRSLNRIIILINGGGDFTIIES